MQIPRAPLIGALMRFASRLRFRQLFFLTAGLFLLDLLIPDVIPLLDEILLGLLVLLFGSWKKRRSADTEMAERPPGRVIDGEVIAKDISNHQTKKDHR